MALTKISSSLLKTTNSGNLNTVLMIGSNGTMSWAEVSSSATSVNVANVAGTVSTNAQPNITSVGNLTTLVISGNATANANLTTNGTLIANANLLVVGEFHRTPVTTADYFEMFDSITGDTRTYTDGVLTTKTKVFWNSDTYVMVYAYNVDGSLNTKKIYKTSISPANLKATATYAYTDSALTAVTLS
jgi:hypothetical protein